MLLRLMANAAKPLTATAGPSGRVNSERSPSTTSWISRTYGGSGSAPRRLASGTDARATSRSNAGLGILATRNKSISPSPAGRSESPSPDAAAALGLAGLTVGVVGGGRIARLVQQLGLLRCQRQLGRGHVAGQLVHAAGAEDHRRYGGAGHQPRDGYLSQGHAAALGHLARPVEHLPGLPGLAALVPDTHPLVGVLHHPGAGRGRFA